MPRALRLPPVGLAVLLAALVLPSSAHAQRSTRIELTPFGGYSWGGSFDTDPQLNIPGGELSEKSSFSWGVITSFTARPGSAVELFYLRQDTKVDFNPDREETRTVGDFANNYIQVGVRQDLNTLNALKPFFTDLSCPNTPRKSMSASISISSASMGTSKRAAFVAMPELTQPASPMSRISVPAGPLSTPPRAGC